MEYTPGGDLLVYGGFVVYTGPPVLLSPFLKPVMVDVKTGALLQEFIPISLAVTVSGAGATVNVPLLS
jgi:hypothetical protein